MFGKRTPGQAPTCPTWLSGDVEPTAQSHQDEKLSKSSEINNAWQIGATGSDEQGRQNGGMSDRWALKPEFLLNMSNMSRSYSRKRLAGDNEVEAEARKRRTLAWMGSTPDDPDQEEDSESESEAESQSEYDQEEDCQDCGSTLEYHDMTGRMRCRTCEWWPESDSD